MANGLPRWMFEGDSARSDEPVTAGLTTGAGPGPEVLSADIDNDSWIADDLTVLAAMGLAEAAAFLREVREDEAGRAEDVPPPDPEASS